jgi:hypothetical protein
MGLLYCFEKSGDVQRFNGGAWREEKKVHQVIA